MAQKNSSTLCILGTGNLGLAILESVLRSAANEGQNALTPLPFDHYLACVNSAKGEQRVRSRLGDKYKNVTILRGDNVTAVTTSQVVILGVDPADVQVTLSEPGMADALASKLLISVAAGWTREQLSNTITSSSGPQNHHVSIVRTLPNIAALVSESITAIEEPGPNSQVLCEHLEITEAIFERAGKTVRVPPRLMDAATAVGGSTPAFFSIICDAMIDAAVATGVPREMAKVMVVQSMKGSAEMMQTGGLSPSQLRDQGTSPEGCTIAGVMVIEEAGIRGSLGRALREAVTTARLMGKVDHVNDTRHG